MTPRPMAPPRPPKNIGAPPPQKMKPPMAPTEEDQAEDSGNKVSKEDCLFVKANEHCGNCTNYQAEDGSCAVVDGQMDPEDACLRHFEAQGEGDQDEDDTADMGDDSGMGGMPEGGDEQ